MANTKNNSAAMELLKDLRQRHDQSLENATAHLKDIRVILDSMKQSDLRMGRALDRLDKGLNKRD